MKNGTDKNKREIDHNKYHKNAISIENIGINNIFFKSISFVL